MGFARTQENRLAGIEMDIIEQKGAEHADIAWVLVVEVEDEVYDIPTFSIGCVASLVSLDEDL